MIKALGGVLVAVALAVWAGVGGSVAAADALARIRAEGVIRIGYAVEAPYALVRGGEVTGESPELAKLVVERLGVAEIDWVQVRFDALLPGLQNGAFDVVAAGMFVTPERERLAVFSAPTVRVAPGFLVRRGNPFRLQNYFDLLVRTEARIAVLAGSVEERDLERRGVSPSRLHRVADAEAGGDLLAADQADVLALSLPTVRWMARGSGGALEAVAVAAEAGQTQSAFQVGFAFARSQGRLARAWNAAQAEVLGSPAHVERIAPFGFADADILR